MATTTSLPNPPSWRWWHWLSGRRIRTWTPTAAGWAAGAFAVLIFATEWKVIVTRIPFIRGRYPPPAVEEKKKEENDAEEE